MASFAGDEEGGTGVHTMTPLPHSFSLYRPQVLVQTPALVYSLGGEGDVEPDAEYGESGRVLNWP